MEAPLRTASASRWRLDLESFGVPYSVATDSSACARRLAQYLVPGSAPTPVTTPDATFEVQSVPGRRATFVLRGPTASAVRQCPLADALHALSAQLRLHVATAAEQWVFVHAGVVAWEGQLLVMPAHSFGGKTRLVAELLRRGATYYSDEYAVLDADGIVHPYPKPLSIRRGSQRRGVLRTADTFGASVGTTPLPISLVIQTQYVRGQHWRPRTLTRGEVILALLGHTVSARLRPRQTVATLVRSTATVRGFAGTRGRAEVTVGKILDVLAGHSNSQP